MLRRELLRLGAVSLTVRAAGCLDGTTLPNPFARTPAPSPVLPELPVRWLRRYRRLGDVDAILPAADGYLLVGDTYVGTESLASLVALRVDGGERWRRTYSTLGWRYAGVPLAGAGGCSSGVPNSRRAGRRARSRCDDGDGRWRRSFPATDGVLTAAAPGPDGAVVLCGYRGAPDVDERPWAVCLDANGALRWSHAPDVRGEFEGVAPAPDGYVLVVTRDGETDDASATKLDAEGREVWSRHYPELGRLYGVRATDGGYVLFGEVSLGPDDLSRPALLAVDESGDPRWGYRYDPSDPESFAPFRPTDLLAEADGSLVLAGNHFVRGVPYGPDYRPALLGVAPGGAPVEWLAAYGGGASGGAEAVVAAPEGYLYGGWTTENGHDTAVPTPTASNVDPFSAVPLSAVSSSESPTPEPAEPTADPAGRVRGIRRVGIERPSEFDPERPI